MPASTLVEPMTTAPLRVAVLVSGRGSNLAALIEARDADRLPVQFVLAASDHADARALRLAESHNVPTLALDPHGFASRREYDLELFRRVAASGAELVVLAGFMRIIDGEAVAPWLGRMINIHPSLLPKYRGLHTHRKALAAGDSEHGASVHFVTAELDGGPVIAQAVITIAPGDTEDTLAARLLPFEHNLLPATLAAIASGQVQLTADGITYAGAHLRHPLRLVDTHLEHA